MDDGPGVRLSELTSLRVGGPAERVVEATSQDAIVDAVRACDASATPLLLVGGGTNLVVADAGFPGTVVLVHSHGVDVRHDGDLVVLDVAAGEPWDHLVDRTVEEGWSGLEALSGIPGLTGATPVQNVGAYGQEVGQTLVSVLVHDRQDDLTRELAVDEIDLGYRTSLFKMTDRFVVLSVRLRLERSDLGQPVAYPDLARVLGTVAGRRVPSLAVRAAVLGLRRSKGMVLDSADLDCVSVGSFFTNPVLSANAADLLPVDAPRFSQPDGRVKTSAAWLIERAGFSRGFGHGDARISSKHTLALTNRGDATTEQVLDLARELRDGVRTAFGIELVPEPRLIGCSL